MKTLKGVRMRELFATAFVLGLMGAAPASAEVTYLCSGTSEDERQEAETTPHSLKLVYSDAAGSFLGNVTTRIANGQGETLVDTECAGPWLLVDLPPGDYEIESRYQGESKTQTLSIEGDAPREQVVTF